MRERKRDRQFQYPRLDRRVENSTSILIPIHPDGVSVSTTGSKGRKRHADKCECCILAVSVSTTGSKGRKRSLQIYSNAAVALFQYPRLDRRVENPNPRPKTSLPSNRFSI